MVLTWRDLLTQRGVLIGSDIMGAPAEMIVEVLHRERHINTKDAKISMIKECKDNREEEEKNFTKKKESLQKNRIMFQWMKIIRVTGMRRIVMLM